MNRQVLIDRILETENLTDNLEDEDADALINWGIAQVDPLVGGVDDEDVAGEKINQLMHLMRQINSIAGDPSSVSQQKLRKFIDQYVETFGKGQDHEIREEERNSLVDKLAQMQPGEVVKYLLEWMHPKKR